MGTRRCTSVTSSLSRHLELFALNKMKSASRSTDRESGQRVIDAFTLDDRVLGVPQIKGPVPVPRQRSE
jgi:hypothetical protein